MSNMSNHSESKESGAKAKTSPEPSTSQSEQNKEKKHDSGAADLEKVTDYAEEKEILSSSTDLEDAIANISMFQYAYDYNFIIIYYYGI